MKKLKFSLILSVALVFISPAVFAQSTSGESYDNAKKCYADVKADVKKSSNREEWEKCVDLFEKVNAAFPTTERGKDALFSAARLRRELYYKLRDKSDVEAAINLYNQFIREYPKNTLADDALYQIAVLRHKPLRQDDKARAALNHLIKNYPKGDMLTKAKVLLASLGGTAEKEKDTVISREEPLTAEEQKEVKKAAAKSYLETNVAGPLDGAILSSINVKDGKNSTVVDLNFSRPVGYSVEFTERGARTGADPRLELSLSYTKASESLPNALTVNSPHLRRIKMKKRFFGSGNKLLFVMQPGSTYEVFPHKSKISLTFKPGVGSTAVATPVAAKTENFNYAQDSKKKSSR